jgi:hypothetical protein
MPLPMPELAPVTNAFCPSSGRAGSIPVFSIGKTPVLVLRLE